MCTEYVPNSGSCALGVGGRGGIRGESLEEAEVHGAAEVWAKPWYLLSESMQPRLLQGSARSCTRGLGLMGHSIPGPKGWGWGHCQGWRVIGGEMPPWAPWGRMELHSSVTPRTSIFYGGPVCGVEKCPQLWVTFLLGDLQEMALCDFPQSSLQLHH